MKNQTEKYKFIETFGAFLVDMVALLIAYYLGYVLRFGDEMGREAGLLAQGYIVFVAVCICYNILANGYERIGRRGKLNELTQVIRYSTCLLASLTIFMYVTKSGDLFSRLFIGFFVLIHIADDYLLRQAFKSYLMKFYKEGAGSEKFIVVTTSDRIEELHDHIQADKAWSYEIVGICLIDKSLEQLEEIAKGAEGEQGDEVVTYYPVLSGPDEIIETIRLSAVDTVLILCENSNQIKVREIVEAVLKMGVNVSIGLSVLPNTSAHINTGRFAKFPVISYNMSRITYGQMAIKRIMDIAVGLVGSVITILMTPFIALAIKLDSPGPVFFTQVRIGKNGRRFKIIKFRSMYRDAEERKKALMDQNEVQGLMFKMENDPRVTKVGAFIRKTSLDEFPQFFSVLMGDMTLIGTRPPTVDEFEKYNDYYRRRISMKPGLTGLWQVSGRSDITDFDDVVKLDLEYIDNWSLSGDIKIFIQTIGVVLFGKGAK